MYDHVGQVFRFAAPATIISQYRAGTIRVPVASNNSAAVDTMSIENFFNLMASLVSAELVETLEKAFVSGSIESGQPYDGLDNLTWTAGKNLVEMTDSTTDISAADVARGLSLLPQKYARNATLLMNAKTLYNVVGLLKGTS